MFIDAICAVLLVWALFKGFSKGLIVGLFSFLAFFIGLAAALKLSATTAGYLGHHIAVGQRWLPFLAFVLVFLAVVFLVKLGAKAIEGIISIAMLGWLNKIGGFLFYALIYLFVFSIVLFYADQLGFIKPETQQTSVAYPFLKMMGPKMINALGSLIPWFKNMFGELGSFFEQRAH